ncbi:MAG: hypothetical protein K0M45_04430 [Candidatus Paracaedibacteraceae bacterium]|nr:hypothetical protein [Candidatus Paracaedibacteraceae bacterium]
MNFRKAFSIDYRVNNKMRIMVFGRPGSGKSTFAVEMVKKLSLPVYHVDKIFFKSHWQKRSRENFLTLKQEWID